MAFRHQVVHVGLLGEGLESVSHPWGDEHRIVRIGTQANRFVHGERRRRRTQIEDDVMDASSTATDQLSLHRRRP